MKKIGKKILLGLFSLTLTFVLVACGGNNGNAGNTQKDKLVLQFVPTRAGESMDAKAKPLGDLLSKELGIDVEVTIATDYTTIIEAMASNKVDIGIMPPNSYVQAHDQGAADAVLQALIPATSKETGEKDFKNLVDGFHGEILVRADSGINSLDDLKAKTIAVQNAASASGYIFPVVELKAHGFDINNDLKLQTVQGIDTGIMSVVNKDVDATLSFEGGRTIVKKDVPTIFQDVKVLYLTEKTIPNDAIAVSSQMDEEMKEKVKAAFLAIAKDEEGKAIISDLYSHQGYVASDDSKYDVVREYSKKAAE